VFDAGAGLPLCFEYWFNTWGPAQFHGYWIWGGQARAALAGMPHGTEQCWYYWDGVKWVLYSSYWL
jgi:hypothetical protein